MFNIENDVSDDNAPGWQKTALAQMLEADDLEPGADASYSLCKLIYLYHPLGAKMVDRPVKMAMYEPRKVQVQSPVLKQLADAYDREWKAIKADAYIANVARQSRIYGVASIAMLVNGEASNEGLDFTTLAGASLSFNVLDPLNTAGSIVLNQDPNATDFQKVNSLSVNGKNYHSSRYCVIMNEDPIYLAYNGAAFGFNGRSAYQRALFPLKSYIQVMRSDNMVARKAGLIIAKMKNMGSAIQNKIQQAASSVKRMMLRQGGTGDVLQIGADDIIESLNLQNLDSTLDTARNHIIADIASACDMPAIIMNSETFTKGFGEGTEDAKAVAVYIDDVRRWLEALYQFFIRIVQYRAWDAVFFENLKREIPEIEGNWASNFADWQRTFDYVWPSSLKEPESEKVKVDETRAKTVVSVGELMLAQFSADPENRANVLLWMAENVNMNERMFGSRLELDGEALLRYQPPAPPTMGGDGALGKEPELETY